MAAVLTDEGLGWLETIGGILVIACACAGALRRERPRPEVCPRTPADA